MQHAVEDFDELMPLDVPFSSKVDFRALADAFDLRGVHLVSQESVFDELA